MAIIKDIIPVHDISTTFEYICNSQKTAHVTETIDIIDMIRKNKVADIMASGYGGASISQDLCLEQFRLARALYYEKHPHPRKMPYVRIKVEDYLRKHNKTRLPKKLANRVDEDGMISIQKQETIALHIIVSFHETDRLTPKTVRKIMDALMEHEHLKGFLAIAVPHWNTDNTHFHILLSNFHPSGCHKLCLTTRKVRELRRFLDRICYEHSLSIVNSREARSNPEHREWIDKVISEGKITVWPAKNTSTKDYIVSHAKKVFDTYSKSKVLKNHFQRDFWASHAEGWRYLIPNEVDITLKSAFLLDKQNKCLDPSSVYRVNAFMAENGIGREKSRIEILLGLSSKIIEGESLFYDEINQAITNLNLYNQRPENEGFSLFLGPDLGETNTITNSISDCILIARALNIRSPKEAIYLAEAIDKKIVESKEALIFLARKISKTPQLNSIYKAISSCPKELSNDELFLLLRGNKAFTSESDIQQSIKLYYNICSNQDYLRESMKELETEFSMVKRIDSTLTSAKLYMSEISEANKHLLSYCHNLREEDYNLLSEYCNEHYSNYEDFLSKKYHSLDKKIADAKANTTINKNKGITKSLEVNR